MGYRDRRDAFSRIELSSQLRKESEVAFIRHKMDNGLRVVGERMPHLRSVSVGVWVQTGAVKELAGEAGLSHFIEHMLFKGTKRRSAQQIAQEMDSIGANINAYTAREYTCFYIKVTDDQLDAAVEMLADLLRNAKLDPVEMEKEKGVVIEEILMSLDSPEDVVQEQLGKAFFGDHPYGAPILGTQGSVSAFRQADLRHYIEKHYTPENMVMAVAGNFDEMAMLDAVQRYFGDASSNGQLVGYPLQPAESKKTLLVNHKDIEQAHLMFALPGYGYMDPLYFPLAVLNNALGGYMSSRLFQKIREDKGLVYSVYSYALGHHDCGMTCIYAGTGQKQAEKVAGLVLDELRDLRTNGLGKEEFQRSKQQLKGSLLLAGEGSGARMSNMGRMVILFDTLREQEETLTLLERVTMEDVASVCEEVLDERRWCASFVGPDVAALTNLGNLWG